jgi:alpha-galactosidase
MCNQAGEIEFIDRYLEEGIKLDYWWMDAGWYPCDGMGWPKVGTWEVDKKRYPDGLRGVTDHAHKKGVKALVWFEPERVVPETWLYENHPEWLLGRDGDTKLLNLGDPDARKWLTDHVDKFLTEQGIDLYRQDFNIDPLGFWRNNDTDDRQGITEIRYVEGYLAYWDALRRRHPGMLIDSCASGGRRNDLETMRRAVPLLRTDCEFHSVGNQCHTYGFDLWLPYHECGNRDIDPYNFRSNMSPWMGFVWDVRRKDLNYELARLLVSQWRQVADYYFGDLYPLTPYSMANDVWLAWQFDRPDLGEGMIQAFRRADSFYESARLKLRELDPEAQYIVTNLDENKPQEMTGSELIEKGLVITILDCPGAVIITYKKII